MYSLVTQLYRLVTTGICIGWLHWDLYRLVTMVLYRLATFGICIGFYFFPSTGATQFNFSGKLLAILHHLEKKGAAHPSIKRLKEIVQQEPRHYESPYDDEIGKGKKHEHLIPESLEVEKDIFCKVRLVSIVLL